MGKLRGLLRLVVVMIGWVLIFRGLTVSIWLGVVVAAVLVALWLWWLRRRADRGSDWTSMILYVFTWAAWALAAWVGLIFAIFIGAVVGSELGLWDFYIADR